MVEKWTEDRWKRFDVFTLSESRAGLILRDSLVILF